ncbi:class I SAM-dependent methyltransferase [Sphingobacterium sp. SYP-B4668]|uniref:class I SAM-dependent methyltransferase n=1 Tax=Sphingobacterium sp. SYP-B4668 TaxID=2996035 RepID=UPI0022DD51BC|nr:class I SAM-dependent methyltransferase [Sphingobacterium sp. SYP-B4668]
MASNEELKALASQLKDPKGAKGIEIAEMMDATNIKMTLHAIDYLQIQANQHILELGHGNCGHLHNLLARQQGLRYSGLETSELMYTEAQRKNKAYTDAKQAAFFLYDGLHIPFPEHTFDRIFTVNTIYFWSEPHQLLSELARILQPEGVLNITFAQERFMQQLPFTTFGFNLYDENKAADLINGTTFYIQQSNTQTETIESKTGELVNREFTTLTLKKRGH